MLAALVCKIIALQACFYRFGVAASSAAGQESSPWFVRCNNAGSIELSAARGAGDPDRLLCSVRCPDQRYQVAALSSETCYCGNQLHGLVVSGCFNTSSSQRTKELRVGREKQSALHRPEGSMVLFGSEGPFLLHLRASPDMVHAGRTFVVDVSGNLCGPPSQWTGLGRVELSVETPKGQRSCHVNISQDGWFTVPSDWMLKNPGKYEINVCVSSPLSTLSSSLHLSVSQLPPDDEAIPVEISASILLTNPGSIQALVEVACRGEPVSLQACVSGGLVTRLQWRFTHEDKDKTTGGRGTESLSGPNSIVSWTFDTDGVQAVSENASSGFEWTQETVDVVVVPPSFDADTQVFTTIKPPLVFKLSLEAEYNRSYEIHINLSRGEKRCNHAVRIYADKQAYRTNTDVLFTAVADVPDPVEFLWDFGDSVSARTTSRTITKRYHHPRSYSVVVVASSGHMSITSDVFLLVVERAVRLNRLVLPASVLQNQTVTLSCRVTVGTNLSFLWSFGDGTARTGLSTEQHVFHRTGEFRVEATASNLVSSASVSSLLFVVDRPCQPPPVKNMGPLKLQVRRHEVLRLGVTLEAEVDCDVSGNLHYTWTLFDSAGQRVPLPLINTHRQELVLQSHSLRYDTYTALARVQIIGSVVYSNYTVRVQVMPSPLVALIQGGTNIFIDKKSTNVVTLDGRASYDPDFPLQPLSYSWTCKPVSTITSSCFNQTIPTSSPLLSFPVSLLKQNFDQFQLTFTVHSGERSASSDTFLCVTSGLAGRVSISCLHCQGDHVNSDQAFSVSAVCEDCDIAAELIQYSWSLYLVNASSKPVIDVPFCYTVDIRVPAAIVENPVTSTQTAESSALHHPDVPESQSARDAHVSPSTPLENWSEKQNFEPGDNAAASHKDRESSMSPLVFENSNSPYPDDAGRGGFFGEFPGDPDSSGDWDFSFPFLESGDLNGRQNDYDVPFPTAVEGDPGMSAGRATDVDFEKFSLGGDSACDPATHRDEGSDLVIPKPFDVILEPSLLDLHRDAVDRGLFESYTYTGISSSLLRFRPFSLRPANRYMLEVIAKFEKRFLGRTQLFLKTSSAPKGMMCQVQPDRGTELDTHFGIFCTSGREDLLYKYSFSVAGNHPRILYQGRDFQYYFSLPSGDPGDDYKVNVYTEIRSSSDGSATQPCSVSVQVKPSFVRSSVSPSSNQDPDLELCEAGLRNLSMLVQLGNAAEIRNYVSLLSIVLNRLSLDADANTHTQSHMRNVLICTVCRLESGEQVSVEDNIFLLNELLQFPRQVTFASARQITAHIRGMSEQISESGAPDWHQRMVGTQVGLLSKNLHVVISHDDYAPETLSRADLNHAHKHCKTEASTGPHIKQEGSMPTKKVVQLVDDILQTASDLMLNPMLFHETSDFRVSTDLMSLYAGYQNQTSSVISCGSTTFHMPASLTETPYLRHIGGTQRREQRLCVRRVVTELANSPYTWATYPTQLSGPVVDLSLYRCTTRRKVPVRLLLEPVTAELQQPQRDKSSVPEHILLRSQINYHNFTVTQELLQRAIQVTVVFTPPPSKAFPIMLLFRMFERPTPSMHHLQRIQQWESNSTRITLPPSYLSVAGVGHLALLDADFEKRKHQRKQISYSLTVDSSLCLSWDVLQGAWTHRGCRTKQNDAKSTVNCSCHQLRPLTVLQQQIQTSRDKADLDLFVSRSSDLTVLGILMLGLCLYIPGLVWCKRADVIAEENQRVHYLSDNSPTDQYLYAVTVHTGLCSAARMTAKVFIVLYGDDGFSQTKELQVPGCTLFRRNCKDTFILSAADSLGSLWGVHIWHDNSGPSPDWYLDVLEVSEVKSGQVGGRSWLFGGQCWLAVNKGDGRVERMLRLRTHGTGFAKMFFDYLADFHMWMSVYSRPCPNAFTHTQRLNLSLLLLMGYGCVNAVIVSLTEDRLPFQLGIIDLSTVSITTGLMSVAAVSPAAAVISFLFRLGGIKIAGSGVLHANNTFPGKHHCEDAVSVTDRSEVKSEPHLTRTGLQQKLQDINLISIAASILESEDRDEKPVFRPDVVTRGAVEDAPQSESSVELFLVSKWCDADQTPESLPESIRSRGSLKATREDLQSVEMKRALRPTSLWCCYLAWALCLISSLSCLLLAAALGLRFSSAKVLLWIHALFISLVSSIFLIQPAVILAVAVVVSCWRKSRSEFHCFINERDFPTGISRKWIPDGAEDPEEQLRTSALSQKRSSELEKLEARQRARYLRLVRPPAQAELRKARGKRRREALIRETLRDFFLCTTMLLLMLCVTSGSSAQDHYHLNRAVRRHFMRNHDNGFMSITSHEDWWKWAHRSLLDFIYGNSSAKTEQSCVVIGAPVVQKTEMHDSFQTQVPMATLPRTRDATRFSAEPFSTVHLGPTKFDAASKLRHLQSRGWLSGQTVALKVQFTLYSAAPSLFSSVVLLAEQSHGGALLLSARVQSVRLHHTPAAWDSVVMLCQLLFLLLSVLQLCHQVCAAAQQGLMGYWRRPCSWLEASLLITTLVCYVSYTHRSTMIAEVLQRRHGGHVDVSVLAAWEQLLRSARGITVVLLSVKCVIVLRVNRTLAPLATVLSQSFSRLFRPAISGLILAVALTCSGNLLHIQSSWALSAGPCSLLKLLCRYRGLLSLTSAFWTALAAGAMSSLVRKANRAQSRRSDLTAAEVLRFIGKSFSGKQKQVGADYHEEGRTAVLEEAESLVDELLFRLNALSSSLHHTLPPKAHRYTEDDASVISNTPELSDMDAQNWMRSQMMLKPPHVSNGEESASFLFRSQFEEEVQKVLPHRGHMRHSPAEMSEAMDDELKIKNCQTCPESTTSRNHCLSRAQARSSEVMVEVLVHKDPGAAEPDLHWGP
ncbi:polycystin-1-like protein 1 [Cololabis saira]|uniref:polycystin-1-like protein 1 n=1 Tax=Cololabis saira TaxID=129043 RepID=UPI002AD292C0|nr:polycystin-1-like protein 1 [Cololabis saira]